jgi:hypothetical protein
MDRADEDVARIQLELAKQSNRGVDVKGALPYADFVPRNAGALSQQFIPSQRQRFFSVVFPEGANWTGEAF